MIDLRSFAFVYACVPFFSPNSRIYATFMVGICFEFIMCLALDTRVNRSLSLFGSSIRGTGVIKITIINKKMFNIIYVHLINSQRHACHNNQIVSLPHTPYKLSHLCCCCGILVVHVAAIVVVVIVDVVAATARLAA